MHIPGRTAKRKNKAAAHASNPETVGNSALRYVMIGEYM